MSDGTLPKGVQTFDHVDGVWVTDFKCAVPVALALRQLLVEVAGARLAGEGQQSKMELVYDYLTGPRFRHRIEAIASTGVIGCGTTPRNSSIWVPRPSTTTSASPAPTRP